VSGPLGSSSLVAACGFVIVGVALLAGQGRWWRATLVVVALSLILSALWVQQAFAGVAISVVIIVVLATSEWARGLAK